MVLDHGTFKANQPPLAPKRKLKVDRKKTDVGWQWAPYEPSGRRVSSTSLAKKGRRVRRVPLRAAIRS